MLKLFGKDMDGPLRINLADDKKTSGIEMGKSILKPMSGNKVAPILDETSILKDSSLVSFFGFSFLHLILIWFENNGNSVRVPQ